jgi:hypothetical protein
MLAQRHISGLLLARHFAIGLVLVHGKARADWIVHEDDSADGQNITVAGLTNRGTKEVGGR